MNEIHCKICNNGTLTFPGGLPLHLGTKGDNDSVLRLATNRQQDLCDVISSILVSDNGKSLKLIIDGVFTNIINKDISDKEKTEIIERLATILWQLIL